MLEKALGDTGRGVFKSERGAAARVSLMDIDGGQDARYVVAVNDSHIQTQADWHQVKERLIATPNQKAPEQGFVYDCTEEKPLGPLGPIDCDLSMTTARVFAVLTREIKTLDVQARQSVPAGRDFVVDVRMLDDAGQPLRAVLPVHLVLTRPDGRIEQDLYRAVGPNGRFNIQVPIGANAPPGNWSLAVRCQLTGELVTLPIVVTAPEAPLAAVPMTGRVVVRGKAAIQELLAFPSPVVIPVFESPVAGDLRRAARKVREVLAAKGVKADIRYKPGMTTYWLSYDPTDQQKQENEWADRGDDVGKIKRETVNSNDWYSSLSGYRFGAPVILLDLASQRGDNPMAEALDGDREPGRVGILWPQVSEAFPGKGRAVVQGVRWAFAPRVPAVVIQAWDVEGLMAGAEALADVPDDTLTRGIQSVKERLWRENGIPGEPIGMSGATDDRRGPQGRARPAAVRDPLPGRAAAAGRPGQAAGAAGANGRAAAGRVRAQTVHPLHARRPAPHRGRHRRDALRGSAFQRGHPTPRRGEAAGQDEDHRPRRVPLLGPQALLAGPVGRHHRASREAGAQGAAADGVRGSRCRQGRGETGARPDRDPRGAARVGLAHRGVETPHGQGGGRHAAFRRDRAGRRASGDPPGASQHGRWQAGGGRRRDGRARGREVVRADDGISWGLPQFPFDEDGTVPFGCRSA